MRIEATPDGLRIQCPAKVNLYLEVGPRRDDGYHDIDSIFQAVTLYDTLEIRPGAPGEIRLEEVGIAEAERNLVLRAARRLAAFAAPRAREPFSALLRLQKRIPEGAGLGGGSSDAAAALVGLSRHWSLGLGARELAPLALELGSDVPFFLTGGTARCRGRGEHVEDWSREFEQEPALHYVLAYPRVKVPTRIAYESLDASRDVATALTASSPLDSIPPASVRFRLGCGEVFFNRFESVVFSAFPEVRDLHAVLSREPFLKVLMSGSGSTVYGLAISADSARTIAERLRGRVAADIYVVESERTVAGAGPR